MTGLLEAIFGLVDKALGIAQIKIQRQHLDRMVQLRKDIVAEEQKGHNSDDAKIEALYKELKIEIDAVAQELALNISSK